MSSRNRTPSILEPYLRLPPEASLILLTNTLGCSINWLVVRFIASLLSSDRDAVPVPESGGTVHDGSKETAVILASFMHNADYWKTEWRRGGGMDMSKLAGSGRLAFVDCFTTLSTFAPEKVLEEIEKSIAAAFERLTAQGKRVVLVFDNPDVLLALAYASAQQLQHLLLRLRSRCHSAIEVCSADSPFLAAATNEPIERPTPIEAETAAFVVQQAHAARLVMSVRDLDTGAAKDVSGVLRITGGGTVCGDDDDGQSVEVKEMEALYLVQRDGNAKVFERGSAG